MTKTFIGFAYPDYYPFGGAHDAYGVFDSLEAALAARPTGCSYERRNLDVLQLPEMLVHEYELSGGSLVPLGVGLMRCLQKEGEKE
jgi:hypothetical protein